MSQQINLFATRRDLEPGLRLVESKHRFKYVLAGVFDSPGINPINSAIQIENLGIALHGNQVHEPAYLVTYADNDIKVREIRLKKGGLRYAIDQLINKNSIIFQPGGIYQEHSLISGRIGTASESAESIKLYQIFTREVTKGFTKIKSYSVGSEAAECLDRGMRLTHNIRRSSEYDLKR